MAWMDASDGRYFLNFLSVKTPVQMTVATVWPIALPMAEKRSRMAMIAAMC